jgi:fatty acid CoA ligase FadD36
MLLRSLGTSDLQEAVVVDGVAMSRADLLGSATAAAERIAGLDRVAVWAQPTLSTVVAVAGALLAGAAVVPVPPDCGVSERRHLLADSGARAWLGAAPAPGPEEPRPPVVPVRLHARSWHTPPEPDPDAAALILYTSGTTGRPKGVVVSRRALAAGFDALAAAWEWTDADTVVHGLPLYHLHGLALGVLGPLRIGSRLVHTGKPTPERYAAAPGTIYFGVPTVWSRIVDNPSFAAELRRARLVVSGSAPLPTPVFARIAELVGQAPIERYGMTETGVTLSTRAAGERRPGWVGLPVAGVSTRLRDESGAEVLPDGSSIGGLEVRGPMLFDGYLGRPDATAAAWTADGWFVTGDVAVVDPDGFHRIVGRASVDLIKTGGFRVGAGEVESSLLAHPAVAEAAVVGVADADLGQRIVGYVVLREPLAEQTLIDHVAAELSAHKRPREIRVVDELPRNAMGKVCKKLLA